MFTAQHSIGQQHSSTAAQQHRTTQMVVTNCIVFILLSVCSFSQIDTNEILKNQSLLNKTVQSFKDSKTNGRIVNGLNQFDMDISNLNSGTYLYSITADGIKVKSNKINIVK